MMGGSSDLAGCGKMGYKGADEIERRRSPAELVGRASMSQAYCSLDVNSCSKLHFTRRPLGNTHTESMTIHPTSGGEAPLYNPFTPSFRTVCSVQSNGPLKCPSLLVWRRTLTVSNLPCMPSVIVDLNAVSYCGFDMVRSEQRS